MREIELSQFGSLAGLGRGLAARDLSTDKPERGDASTKPDPRNKLTLVGHNPS